MRLEKLKGILIYIFYIVFAITFSYIFVTTFIYNVSYNYSVNKFTCFIVGIFIFIVWYFIYKVINQYYDKLSPKQEFLLLLSTFIIISLIILMILTTLKLTPNWDYHIIYEQAKSYVLYGDRYHTTTSPSYFQYYNNNIGLFLILVIIFKFCHFIGISDFITVMTIINAILVGISILLLYLCVRKLLDKKKAFFSLVISLFFVPLFTYIPMFYTDTFSLPFVMLVLYLYLCIDKDKIFSKRNIVLFIFLLIIAFLGSRIKMTILVIFIACIIHFIFTNKIKYIFCLLLITCLFFSISSFFWKTLIYENKEFDFIQNDYGNVPLTHYLMMGVQRKDDDLLDVNCLGCYNRNDFALTFSYYNSKEAFNYDMQEYLRRVKEYGILGYFNYLSRKAVNAWGEGSYFSDFVYRYNYNSTYNNRFRKLVIGDSNKTLLYFEQGVSEATLLIFGCYGFILLVRRKKIDKSTIIPISIYGMFIVLLFWENRSRYLYNYIPIFIILITLFYHNIIEKKSV